MLKSNSSILILGEAILASIFIGSFIIYWVLRLSFFFPFLIGIGLSIIGYPLAWGIFWGAVKIATKGRRSLFLALSLIILILIDFLAFWFWGALMTVIYDGLSGMEAFFKVFIPVIILFLSQIAAIILFLQSYSRQEE